MNARGGIVGPDLSNAGRLSPEVLRQKIVNPNAVPPSGRGGGRGGATPATAIVKTPDGREIRGVRRNEDTFSLQMIDVAGQLRMFDKRQLSSVVIDSTSLHPPDYATRLSSDEIENLVAYLAHAAGAGPEQDRVRAAGSRRCDLRAPPRGGNRASQLADVLGRLPGHALLRADGHHYDERGQASSRVVGAGARRQRQREHAARRRRRDVCDERRQHANGHRDGRPHRAADLAIHASAEGPQSRGDRRGEPRRRDPRASAVRRHQRRRPRLPRRADRPAHLGGPGRGHDGRLQHHEPAAHREGQDHRRARRRRVRACADSWTPTMSTGKRLWRFHTIPGPGELGHDTWKGDSWKTGGGGTWLTGTYDPELDTLYWPIGNPAAMTDRSVRGDGDNLFTDSVVALDPDTGQRKWHYQFTPNDGHDWDSTEDMVLVDRMWRGQPRKLLLHADRNGHFYVLDRTNGAFLSGTPFIYQNWNTGFDAKGRPMPVPGSNSSPEGSFLVYPTPGGATNFQAPSYSPITGWFYRGVFRGRRAVRERAAGAGEGQGVPGQCAEPRRSTGARAERPGAECRHQGDRSGDGQDRLGLQAVSGLARKRRAGDRGGCAVRVVARRQRHRARREDRDAPLALSDRRQPHGLADQLRDRWPSVRRADGGQRLYSFALPE